MHSYKLKIKIAFCAVGAAALLFSAVYAEKSSGFINLTLRINTEGDDYAPSITADGKTAVFNSRMPEEKSHNIFMCISKNGLWGDPFPVPGINSDSNEETPFISADGKTMLFASDRPGGYSPPVTSDGKKRITFDIYITHFVNGKWTEPEILKGTVNTTMNERAPGLSPDGKTLFFTRWPYNNPGKSKIYSAVLEDGGYTKVKALPPSINTGNFEIGMRPSYKSGRYYYSSRKPGGSGGWDIYYTTLKGKAFSKPVNAGEGINTPYDDMYFSESKTSTVISSDRVGGCGKFDLYSSIPAENPVAEPVKKEYVKKTESVIRITAIDKNDGKEVKNIAFRVLINADREKESIILRKTTVKSDLKGVFTLNPKDDADSVIIEPLSKKYRGNSFKLSISKGNFQDIAIYLTGKTIPSDEKKYAKLTVPDKNDVPEEKNYYSADKPLLKTIYFKLNSSDIQTEYIPEIHALVEFMRNNPEYSITITGYSDPTGSARFNDRLSMKRAKSAADIIRSLDIPKNSIKVRWYGELKSVSGIKGSRYSGIDRRVELDLKKQ